MSDPVWHLIYHADSGPLAAAWDIAHKVVSPATYRCDLCALTHGVLREHRLWRAFRERSAPRLRIWHRDEFTRAYPGVQCQPPCVLCCSEGRWQTELDAASIAELADVEALIARLESASGHP